MTRRTSRESKREEGHSPEERDSELSMVDSDRGTRSPCLTPFARKKGKKSSQGEESVGRRIRHASHGRKRKARSGKCPPAPDGEEGGTRAPLLAHGNIRIFSF